MVQSDHDAESRRSLLVVAGSGRSGTSLMAGLTSRLGLHIPQPELKANDSNPSGFGEPRWAVGFHKELLRSVEVTHEDGRPRAWDLTARVARRERAQKRLRAWLVEQFEHSGRIVVKDPRLAWFIELYRTVAADLSVDLSVITMLRHPAETVRSRQLAYTSTIEGPTRMSGWLNMMLTIEHSTRNLPRAVIQYDDLLSQWQQTLSTAEEPLTLALTSGATLEQIRAADELVNPSLRRAAPDWAELHLPPYLQDLAERVYHQLGELSVRPGAARPTLATETLDGLRDEYADYYRASELVTRSSIVAARAAERRRLDRQRARQRVERQRANRQGTKQPEEKQWPLPRRTMNELKTRTSRLLRKVRT